MPSDKLRLNLAALRLKSFETTPDPNAARGTVVGMDDDSCGACTFCTNSCGQMTWCIGSCGGGSGCTGASQTDSGCEESWNGTCYETCQWTCEQTCQNC
jgi:hypothetical protein